MIAAEPLVSIVVPLYNNAEHLSQCLDSILAQTYLNWECTIVNNCSTDGSAAIARRYADSDPRIRLHENREFLSALANHNAALRQASPRSKYCKVVFADDWILPECLERMVGLAEAQGSVGIVSAYVLEGDAVTNTGLAPPTTVFSGREVCRRHLLDRVFVFGSANSLLYRADLVRRRDSFFDESNVHADNDVCFALLKSCDFGFIHQVLTATRLREGSRNTKSIAMRTSLADWLHVIATYGPEYLDKGELDSLLDRHLSSYYRFLGKSVVRRRDQAFWDYHRGKLSEAGVGFSRWRVARGLIEVIGEAAMHPKDTLARFARRGSGAAATTPSDD